MSVLLVILHPEYFSENFETFQIVIHYMSYVNRYIANNFKWPTYTYLIGCMNIVYLRTPNSIANANRNPYKLNYVYVGN